MDHFSLIFLRQAPYDLLAERHMNEMIIYKLKRGSYITGISRGVQGFN
jgi:hypothetical protein